MNRTSLICQASLLEDSLERLVGLVQEYLRKRGAHKVWDLLREFLASMDKDQFLSDYQLHLRRRAQRPERARETLDKGLVFTGVAARTAGIASIFAGVISKLAGTPSQQFVQCNDRAFGVLPAGVSIDCAWAELKLHCHVVCLCRDVCEHV
jgi:hypothetical protein